MDVKDGEKVVAGDAVKVASMFKTMDELVQGGDRDVARGNVNGWDACCPSMIMSVIKAWTLCVAMLRSEIQSDII